MLHFFSAGARLPSYRCGCSSRFGIVIDCDQVLLLLSLLPSSALWRIVDVHDVHIRPIISRLSPFAAPFAFIEQRQI
jgi:hypothetical protein